MLNIKNYIAVGGNVMAYILTLAQLEQLLYIISLICAIITSLLIITLKAVEWYKKAKKDGKITPDEVSDLVNDVKPDVEQIGSIVDDALDNKSKEE